MSRHNSKNQQNHGRGMDKPTNERLVDHNNILKIYKVVPFRPTLAPKGSAFGSLVDRVKSTFYSVSGSCFVSVSSVLRFVRRRRFLCLFAVVSNKFGLLRHRCVFCVRLVHAWRKITSDPSSSSFSALVERQ